MSADRVVLNGTKNEGGIVLCITGILDCKFINVAEDSLVVLENFQKDFCMNVDALANIRSLVLILHL